MAWSILQPGTVLLAYLVLFPERRRQVNRDVIGGPQAAGAGQFGTSRWQTQKEIDRSFDRWDITKPLDKGGIVLGTRRHRKKFFAYLDRDDTHVLLIGATRSGKSRRVIMTSIWAIARAGESMLLGDVKGELYAMTAGYLQEQGYEVIRLDLRQPTLGNRWNPLQSVNTAIDVGDYAKAGEIAWDVGHIITYQKPHYGDSIWPDSQEALTTALALAVAAEAPTGARHLASAYQLLTCLGAEGGEMLDEYFASLPLNHVARGAYGVVALSEDRLRSSIFTGTAAQLRLWADPGIQWLTAAQDHDLAAPGKTKTAVFIVVPDERSTRHVLASLYVNQVYMALVDLANRNGGVLPVKTHFILDEFGNLPPIPDFAQKLTVAGGRGMKFLLAVQDIGQLKDRYKEQTRTITGNCATWIYLATADVETARLISEKTGRYTIPTESRSSQVRHTEASQSTSQSLTGRALLMPDEVLRWPGNHALILRSRQYPARLSLPDLSEWPIDLTPVENPSGRGVITLPPLWLPFMGKDNTEGKQKPSETAPSPEQSSGDSLDQM